MRLANVITMRQAIDTYNELQEEGKEDEENHHNGRSGGHHNGHAG